MPLWCLRPPLYVVRNILCFCCSYVFDVVRATVPNINLDDVFTVSYQHLLALQS